MKKILSGALAATLLVTAAAPAMAAPRGAYSRSHDYRRDNSGAMIGLGIGLFALGAIIASSQNNRTEVYYGPRYEPRYVPPPPPPRYGYDRYGYDRYDNDRYGYDGYYGR
jgi:hypothetical protein